MVCHILLRTLYMHTSPFTLPSASNCTLPMQPALPDIFDKLTVARSASPRATLLMNPTSPLECGNLPSKSSVCVFEPFLYATNAHSDTFMNAYRNISCRKYRCGLVASFLRPQCLLAAAPGKQLRTVVWTYTHRHAICSSAELNSIA